MSIFKCKMCGGTIEFEQGATVGVCDSCGTRQTLPRLDDDRKANLYDRANHFRRNNDFDKAMGIYEQILNEDNTDAEAYWSLVLCRYGIEYVEDPATHRRVPTVNRAQFTSIYMDEDYKSALQYADYNQKMIYEQEAKAIDDIQKGILEISSKEEPFDVFICYKETDASGRRTHDSVLANDLYHQLTQEGFKVFFARITLEDKLGSAYEPYIFAALNSSKVMVVIGTKPEYFNAVWVKNEWSRYLTLVKNSGGKKMLIPAYKDMDPYDLPEEFSHLQAQDMSKLGFMQDLIRGIKKITESSAPKTVVKETVAVNTVGVDVSPLLERVFLFLEDSKWQDANIYCEKVLDIDPKNAEAYLGKLMTELRVNSRKKLADCKEPFDDRENFAKVIRFGDEQTENELRGYIAHINERNENDRLSALYQSAVKEMKAAKTEDEFNAIASKFDEIAEFGDSEALAEQCRGKAETARKDKIYDEAILLMKPDIIDYTKSALDKFEKIPDWKDSAEQIEKCKTKIEELKQQQEEQRIADEKRKKKIIKITKIVSPIVAVVVVFVILLNTVIIPFVKYKTAISDVDNGKYDKAIEGFSELGDYKDSAEQIIETKYQKACLLLKSEKFDEAVKLFNSLGDYKDSADQIKETKLKEANALISAGDYISAYNLLSGLNYKDSDSILNSIKPQYKEALFNKAEVGSYFVFGSYEQDNDTDNGKEDIEWIVLEKKDDRLLVISKYALDCKQYNESNSSVTWETCTLRKWLNGDFINEAFSSEEKSQISEVTVSADANSEYNTNPGNDTKDKVFLLSIDEVNKYFNTDEARMCAPTAYAKAQGAWTSSDYELTSGEATCWWWLRSPSYSRSNAASVRKYGSVHYNGSDVHNDSDSVRPALWIDLKS